MMIVKFHPRGRGGGGGPVDYLLGKDRQRDGASVLQGKPDEVRELIDASPYAKKYTSGVLSFAEQDLPPGQREKLMASFERVLMPGLDKDQYSVLWVEHRDKGRLELNFLIPNTELLTGKRLQPYYDRADRPRIDAWQTIVNGRLGLHDPERAGEPAGAGLAFRAAGSEAGSRPGDYERPACPCLIRGAENASGRH
ncbi:relaxase/mobilization nuclease domain-containing protein [Escherichia coli]|uniref:relaxase/mobilization nuclease domain-containing protein n=1 Tax=Escherichia coli TaxID=562 RepID=UPI003890F36F